jgi:hypothetical protein
MPLADALELEATLTYRKELGQLLTRCAARFDEQRLHALAREARGLERKTAAEIEDFLGKNLPFLNSLERKSPLCHRVCR